MIAFAHPWAAPTLTIDLPNPELRDATDLSVGIGIKTMMSGLLRTKRMTPVKKKRQLHFVAITRPKAMELFDFLDATQGDLVRYYDLDGKQWRGYLVVDPEQIRTYGRGLGNIARPESVEFDLTFEGDLL